MESIIHKIRFLINQMGPSEKKVAEYILQHPQDVLNLTITELASLSGSTDATIVRFSKRIGFSGYREMKIGIVRDIASTSKVNSEITNSDTCFEIFHKRINDIAIALWNTESVLEPKQLEKAAKAIMNAKRIAIFGLGNSAAIAQDSAHKFLRLGLAAQSCCDNHMQAIIASHLDRQCVAIGISHSGASKDIIEALQFSKIGSATTICITNHANSPIVKSADIALFTKSEETERSILAMSSRIAQLAIFDAIYTYIVLNADQTSLNAIYNTETTLQSKKI